MANLNYIEIGGVKYPIAGYGVPIDATLAREGEAADARATGDAIRAVASNLPEFVRIGGSDEPDEPVVPDVPTGEEYNLITLATEVSTVEELLAYDGIAILKGYEYNGTATPNTDDKYYVLKVPVQAGDVIRDKTVSYLSYTSGIAAYKYIGFFSLSGNLLSNVNLIFDGHASEPPTYLDIRENGVTAPVDSAYALVNVCKYYYINNTTQCVNGLTANVVTLNQSAELTAYDGTEALEDYVPVANRESVAAYTRKDSGGESTETYYEAVDDVRIPRYEDSIKSIESNMKTVESEVKNDVDSISSDVESLASDVEDVAEKMDNSPEFSKTTISEYNEITKAVEVSTFDELKAYDGNAILKNYRHEAATAVTNDQYDILKIIVQPGDVIRDKLATWWKSVSNASGWKYAFFYDASGTEISNIVIYYDGNANSNYLDIRENGFVVPDGCAYVLINIWFRYELLSGGNPLENNKTANIITKNADASLTFYDGAEALPDYEPVEEKTFFTCADDVRIARYDDALGDIETILAEVVGGVE